MKFKIDRMEKREGDFMLVVVSDLDDIVATKYEGEKLVDVYQQYEYFFNPVKGNGELKTTYEAREEMMSIFTAQAQRKAAQKIFIESTDLLGNYL